MQSYPLKALGSTRVNLQQHENNSLVLDSEFCKVQPIRRAKHRNKLKLSEYNLLVFLFSAMHLILHCLL